LYATPVKTKAPQLAAPVIQVSGESSSATAVEDSSTKMQALHIGGDNDDFDAEFTKLAESRSSPILFETPVRRRDFSDDVNHLMATEATAKELMMAKSHEDLSLM